MAESFSRKVKRKSEAFYCRAEGGSDEVGAKKRKTSDSSSQSPHHRCGREFFDQPCEDLARGLLRCVLVRVCGGEECKGKMVETEAYLGGEDKAAHSYSGRRTERNEAMYMAPGTAYVYAVYGVHRCFNISSQGEGAAVLVRAVEPVGGVEVMRGRRKGERGLTNGPAKLCQAMGIDKSCDRLDLVTSEELWVEAGEECVGEEGIVASARIGVGYAGEEWASKPLRFHIKDSRFVSKR